MFRNKRFDVQVQRMIYQYRSRRFDNRVITSDIRGTLVTSKTTINSINSIDSINKIASRNSIISIDSLTAITSKVKIDKDLISDCVELSIQFIHRTG